jgi:hypothetical protein
MEARGAAMRAAHEERIRIENESRRRLVWVVVLLVVVPFFVLMFTIFAPLLGLAKVAAPFACPSGYERAYVKHWQESTGGTKTTSHWELHCITDKGDVKGDDGTVYFISGALGFGMSMSALVTLLVMRRKKRSPF